MSVADVDRYVVDAGRCAVVGGEHEVSDLQVLEADLLRRPGELCARYALGGDPGLAECVLHEGRAVEVAWAVRPEHVAVSLRACDVECPVEGGLLTGACTRSLLLLRSGFLGLCLLSGSLLGRSFLLGCSLLSCLLGGLFLGFLCGSLLCGGLAGFFSFFGCGTLLGCALFCSLPVSFGTSCFLLGLLFSGLAGLFGLLRGSLTLSGFTLEAFALCLLRFFSLALGFFLRLAGLFSLLGGFGLLSFKLLTLLFCLALLLGLFGSFAFGSGAGGFFFGLALGFC